MNDTIDVIEKLIFYADLYSIFFSYNNVNWNWYQYYE
jgi:hypothetical protein